MKFLQTHINERRSCFNIIFNVKIHCFINLKYNILGVTYTRYYFFKLDHYNIEHRVQIDLFLENVIFL